uniref:Short chain dehydrogenase/reductase family 16C, member 5a n=1 Tax=Poecilia mexicana TaxID=48701 RepID=A0A3B3YZZ0_9TELE
MNFFLESIQVLFLSLWYNIESFIHLLVPRKKKNIAGEVVLITGAGSGIGRLMAQEFAAHGTVLVLWDINQEGIKETARLAKNGGASRVHCFVCDCSNKNEVYRVADQVKREVGDVSILVNNAGIVTGKKFMDAPDSLIEKTMEVNTMAHFWTYKAFLPAMIANNHGHLVSIASSAGLIGVNGLAGVSSFGHTIDVVNKVQLCFRIIHARSVEQLQLAKEYNVWPKQKLCNILWTNVLQTLNSSHSTQ